MLLSNRGRNYDYDNYYNCKRKRKGNRGRHWLGLCLSGWLVAVRRRWAVGVYVWGRRARESRNRITWIGFPTAVASERLASGGWRLPGALKPVSLALKCLPGKSGKGWDGRRDEVAEWEMHGQERPGAVQTQHKSVNILYPRIQPARLSVEQRMEQRVEQRMDQGIG